MVDCIRIMKGQFWFYSAILVFVCCEMMLCHILRLSCKEYGNFSFTKENFVLSASVVETFSGITAEKCERNCLLHNQCKSINVEKGDKTCELISSSTAEINGGEKALVRKENWIYKSTAYNFSLVGENCQALMPCKQGELCRDTCDCRSYECARVFNDCKTAYDEGFSKSAVYQITNHGFPKTGLPIFCDMVTGGERWIVFQRRIDGTANFYRGWSDYKFGFGVQSGNFWLGLDKLHLLAAPGRGAILRVDMRDRSNSNNVYAEYRKFQIGSESEGYRLTIDEFSGNAGDSMTAQQSGMKFSTYDHNQDKSDNNNCASRYKGGWWYNKCHESNLNGLYPLDTPSTPSTSPSYMSWYWLNKEHGNIMFSEMKLRYI